MTMSFLLYAYKFSRIVSKLLIQENKKAPHLSFINLNFASWIVWKTKVISVLIAVHLSSLLLEVFLKIPQYFFSHLIRKLFHIWCRSFRTFQKQSSAKPNENILWKHEIISIFGFVGIPLNVLGMAISDIYLLIHLHG